MHTKTQRLTLQGGLILLGALVVSSVGGWARRATADDQPAPVTAPALLGELRTLSQALEATRGELAVARLQLERANAVIEYSTHYGIPAGLARLTPALQRFAGFFDLDPHLVKSAAVASPAKAATVSDATLRKAIGTLSRKECDDYLLRLLQGEAGLGFSLRHRLQGELKAPLRPASGGRTADDLFAGAKREKRQAAERKAAEAEKRRIATLEKLAQNVEQAWRSVEAQLGERHWAYHAKAVEQLQQLRDLADYQKTRADFNRRLKALRERHKERASIMKRLAKARLV